MGQGWGGVGTWTDLDSFVRPQWRKQGQCPGSALPNHNSPEAVWRPNSTAHLGAATAREAPSAPPAPHAQQPSSGRAPALWDGAHRRWGGAGEEATFLQIT